MTEAIVRGTPDAGLGVWQIDIVTRDHFGGRPQFLSGPKLGKAL